MKEYTILTCKDTFNLRLKVNNYIINGWEPIGGAFYDGKYDELGQAMIKEE